MRTHPLRVKKPRPCPCGCGIRGFCEEHRERLHQVRAELEGGWKFDQGNRVITGSKGVKKPKRGIPLCTNPVCDNPRPRGEDYCPECRDDHETEAL